MSFVVSDRNENPSFIADAAPTSIIYLQTRLTGFVLDAVEIYCEIYYSKKQCRRYGLIAEKSKAMILQPWRTTGTTTDEIRDKNLSLDKPSLTKFMETWNME